MEINRQRDESGRYVKPDIPYGFDRKKYRKEYYLKNKERINRRSTEWGRKNKDKRRITKKRWALKNKEHINFLTKQRIYRLKGAEGRIVKSDVDNLFETNNGKCYYCNINASKSIDHVIPISRGGTNYLNNLVPVCISCNSKKGAKLLSEWNPLLCVQFEGISRAKSFNA